MGILSWVILGLIVGSVAKVILPGIYPGGPAITTFIGMVGATLGGFLAQVVFNRDTVDDFFDVRTWLTAILGAVIALAVYGYLARRRSRQVPAPEPPAGGVRPESHKATSRAVPPGHQEEPPVARAASGVRDRVTPRAERPTPTTTGVFISYRRQDPQHLAGRLYDRLRNHFGKERVFMDVDSIELGLDFGDAIEKAVSSTGVMLVLIGDNWLTSTDQKGRRRLDNPDDYVRLEIEATLSKPVRVIPVLIDDATMPSSQELPASLAPLSRRNPVQISYIRFDDDTKRLIDTLERLLTTSGRS